MDEEVLGRIHECQMREGGRLRDGGGEEIR